MRSYLLCQLVRNIWRILLPEDITLAVSCIYETTYSCEINENFPSLLKEERNNLGNFLEEKDLEFGGNDMKEKHERANCGILSLEVSLNFFSLSEDRRSTDMQIYFVMST